MNGNADGLSRPSCTLCQHCDKLETKEHERNFRKLETEQLISEIKTDDDSTNDLVEDNNVSDLEIRTKQLAQEILKIILYGKESDSEKPTWEFVSHLDASSKYYWSQWDRLTVINGVLYRKWLDPSQILSIYNESFQRSGNQRF